MLALVKKKDDDPSKVETTYLDHVGTRRTMCNEQPVAALGQSPLVDRLLLSSLVVSEV